MVDRLSVALLQHSNQGSQAKNLAYIAEQVAYACTQGAHLVLLQELHNERYFCQTEDPQLFDLAEKIPGASSQFLGQLAKQHQCVIVGSIFEHRAAGLYHNTAVVLDRDGTLAGRYRKMHIPDDPGFHEKFYFTPGDLGFMPVQTSLGKLGILVCWDQWYPEAARLMALAGAELLLYPTAIGWNRQDDMDEQQRQLDAWLTIQRSHAIANGTPVLSCNRVGYETSPVNGQAGIEFWGNSFVCGSQGEILAQAKRENSTLLCEVPLTRSEQVRRIWPFLRDRRIDTYQGLNKRYLDED